MSAIKTFLRAFRAMGAFQCQAVTIEEELEAIGYEMERRHQEKISIHDGGFSKRIEQAFDWATSSGLSRISINHYLDNGLHRLIGR